MEEYTVYIERESANRAIAYTDKKTGEVFLDISVTDSDALNPAEFLLSSLGGCILKNITKIVERRMHRVISQAYIKVKGIRSDNPTRIEGINYQLTLVLDKEIDVDRLSELLRKYGTVYNTLLGSLTIEGKIRVFKEDGHVYSL